MPKTAPDDAFYDRVPYAEAFDIDYPQENLEGEMYKYRCKSCKKLTTDINGKLENHAPDCEYRLARTRTAGSSDA
jgi:DNA-directed RNA polymerase subunit RPC12/RpoP